MGGFVMVVIVVIVVVGVGVSVVVEGDFSAGIAAAIFTHFNSPFFGFYRVFYGSVWDISKDDSSISFPC